MTAPDPVLLDRFVTSAEALAREARLLFGAEAARRPDFADGLATLTDEERDVVESMFLQGAQCAVAVLLQHGLLPLPALLDTFGSASTA